MTLHPIIKLLLFKMVSIKEKISNNEEDLLLYYYYSTDEDLSLRIESSAIINLRGVSTKLNKYIVFTMQTYKKLIRSVVVKKQ